MCPVSSATESALIRLPLFPLKTVLYPRGHLALKIFEQRYLAMAKSCLTAGTPFGVCLITRGEEVATPAGSAPEFAAVGTFARIRTWDMPQLGILHLRTEGADRFQVHSHAPGDDGLVVGQVTAIAPEPALPLPDGYQPLAKLLELLIERAGRENFPPTLALDDASWVGYRLAEILPLPLAIKQSMLEINDCEIRLKALAQFLRQQKLL